VRRARTVAVSILAAFSVAAFALTTVISEPLAPLPIDPFWLAFAGLPIVGAVITSKRPSNPVGWTVLGIGVAAALSASTQLAAHAGLPRPDLLVLFNQLAFLPVFFLLPLFFLIFPDGELPSPGWRRHVRIAGAVTIGLGVWFALRPVDYSFDNIEFFPNPWGIDQLATYDGAVVGFLQVALGAFGVAALIRAIRSYRDAGALRRARVKWVLVPAVLGPLVFAAGILLEGFTSREVGNLVVMTGLIGGGNGVALGIGTAVLRHNLFEIDRIISRTVTYAVVVGLLGLTILGLVAGLTMFVPSDDPFVVAIATLTGFALFNPVRRRVQIWVDRRFNRSRYDAARIMHRFSRDLGDQADPDLVVDDWLEVVESTMEPAAMGVWFRD
jgi:hypothetical protein